MLVGDKENELKNESLAPLLVALINGSDDLAQKVLQIVLENECREEANDEMIIAVDSNSPSEVYMLLEFSINQHTIARVLEPFASVYLPRFSKLEPKPLNEWFKLLVKAYNIKNLPISSLAGLDVILLNIESNVSGLRFDSALELNDVEFNIYVNKFIQFAKLSGGNKNRFLKNLEIYSNKVVLTLNSKNKEDRYDQFGRRFRNALSNASGFEDQKVKFDIQQIITQKPNPETLARESSKILKGENKEENADLIVKEILSAGYLNAQEYNDFLLNSMRIIPMDTFTILAIALDRQILSSDNASLIKGYRPFLYDRMRFNLDHIKAIAKLLDKNRFGIEYNEKIGGLISQIYAQIPDKGLWNKLLGR
jgi:hypothetical protein